MTGIMHINCLWGHLVHGLSRTGLAKGIISQRETIQKIVFTTPEGVVIEVPENSRLEIHVGPAADVYAVAVEYSPTEFGMTHGPYLDVEMALKVVPHDQQAVILRFPREGNESILYRANEFGDGWNAAVDLPVVMGEEMR